MKATRSVMTRSEVLASLRIGRVAVLMVLAAASIEADGRLPGVAGLAGGSGRPIAETARLVIEAPRISDCVISPQGTLVVYAVTRSSAARNQYVTELFVQSIARDGSPGQSPILIDGAVRPRLPAAFHPRWCPDGTCVTYLTPATEGPATGALMRFDIRTSRAVPVSIVDEAKEVGSTVGGRPGITAIGEDYRWSASGTMLAFTAPLGKTGRLTPTTGVAVTPMIAERGLSFRTTPNRALFLLNAVTGRIQQLSPNTMSVKAFDWAPDDRMLAIAAVMSEDESDTARDTDVFVIDRDTRQVRPLVSQPGNDTQPSWSPDGRWIALLSEFGKPHSGAVLAVSPSAAGRLMRFQSVEVADVQPSEMPWQWTPDSRAFYYTTAFHMTTRVHRADIWTKKITSLPLEEVASVEDLSVSRDARWLAFERSSFVDPPEVYVRALPDGPIYRVTHLSADFPLTHRVSVEMTHWPSRDGRFTVFGLLLRPRAAVAAPNGCGPAPQRAAPLPTLVYIGGGPSMVRAGFALKGFNPELLSLADHGYAVLVPNTRGRGGYGDAFARAMRDGASYARPAYEDVMSGIEQLVQSGIADPGRLGILGQSYGGYLTAYAVTQTNRFRAAVNYEGGGAIHVGLAMRRMPGTLGDYHFVEGIGLRNPFTPEEMAVAVAESPGLNMHCVATPMLLLYGEQGALKTSDGALFFSALHRFGIPTEFILFDEGHGFSSPAAQQDYVARAAAWFDYWVRDLPYTDPALGTKYDAWRQRQGSTRSSSTPCAMTPASH